MGKRKGKGKERRYHKMSDRYIEGISHFVERGDPAVVVCGIPRSKDEQARIGSQRVTWSFFQEYRRRGKRGAVCKRLGFFPVTTVKEARRLAKIELGRAAAGRLEPGRRQAVKVAEAVATYLATLSGGWARVAGSLVRLYILPEFENWTLAELSASPCSRRHVAQAHQERCVCRSRGAYPVGHLQARGPAEGHPAATAQPVLRCRLPPAGAITEGSTLRRFP